jgi:HemY protein
MIRKIKILFYVALFFAITAAITALLGSDYGYFHIAYGDWEIENSLSKAALYGLLLLIPLYFMVRLLIKIWRFPTLFRDYRLRRRNERARRNIIQGMIELIEGHWLKAENILLKDIETSDTPLLNYLLAARAAQHQEADERRDQYLKMAHRVTPRADIAIGLTQAELQMAHDQTEQALATLMTLRELAPRHPYVMKLLSSLYVQLNEWEKLVEMLPEIRRRRIISGEKLLQLERMVYIQFIRGFVTSRSIASFEERWKLLPSRYRADPDIFRIYIECLLHHNQTTAAERQLRSFLNKRWDDELVQMYGRIDIPETHKLLDQAEAWLKSHGRSPMLLITLARLCCRLQLWGKARAYFETSLAVHPTIEAYAELAELLESLGERDSAHECFRKGLALATSRSYNRRTSDRPKKLASADKTAERKTSEVSTRAGKTTTH